MGSQQTRLATARIEIVLVTPSMLDKIRTDRSVASSELSTLLRRSLLAPVLLRVFFEELDQVSPMLAANRPAVSILAVFLAVTPDEMKFAVIAPPTTQGGLAHWLSITTGFLIYAVIVGIILAPSIFHGVRRNNAHAVAAVWLSAYERELDCSRGSSHRAARAWRRTHPI